MVTGQRHLHPASDADLAAVGHGLLEDRAHGQDRPLGRVDDGGELLHVEHAEVRDGEGRAGELLDPELPAPRALGEVARLRGDLGERLRVAVAEHGGDEPALEGHRDTDVGAVVDADGLALERGVDGRKPTQRQRAGPDHQVGHGDLGAALEGVELRAEIPGAVHGHIRGHVEVRHRALGERQALGDGRAHRRERNVLELDCRPWRHGECGARGCRWSRGRQGRDRRGRGRGRRKHRLDVPPDDAAARARPLQEPQVDPGLGRDLLRQRRGLHSPSTGRRSRRR